MSNFEELKDKVVRWAFERELRELNSELVSEFGNLVEVENE